MTLLDALERLYEARLGARPTRSGTRRPTRSTARKNGEAWRSASGKWYAKNRSGVTRGFSSQQSAQNFRTKTTDPNTLARMKQSRKRAERRSQ